MVRPVAAPPQPAHIPAPVVPPAPVSSPYPVGHSSPAASGSMSLGASQFAAVTGGRPMQVIRSRAYTFAQDARGMPIEIGSGRFAKVYLGEEHWLESKTDFRRPIVIKMLQKNVSQEDQMRF